MKRLFAAIAAVIFFLGAGSVCAGAEESSEAAPYDMPEVVRNIEITCKMSDNAAEELAALTMSLIQKQGQEAELMLQNALKSGVVEVEIDGETEQYPAGDILSGSSITVPVTVPEGMASVYATLRFLSKTIEIKRDEDAPGIPCKLLSEPSETVPVLRGGGAIKLSMELELSGEMQNEIHFSTSGSKLIDKLFTKIEQLLQKFSVSADFFGSDTWSSESVNEIIKTAYDRVYPIAFLLMCLLWLFSVGKSSVSTDLWNKDSCVKPLLRLLWGIGLMAVSMPLLELIFSAFTQLTQIVFSSASGYETLFKTLWEESKEWVDDSWIVGWIITFFNVLWNLPKILAYALIEVIFGLVFYIVIAIRFLKLAVLQCISPFFFACSGSPATEKYTQSFVKEYTIYAAQIFVAYLMYTVITSMYASAANGGLISAAMNLVVYISGIIAVAGSGKFVRNLFN